MHETFRLLIVLFLTLSCNSTSTFDVHTFDGEKKWLNGDYVEVVLSHSDQDHLKGIICANEVRGICDSSEVAIHRSYQYKQTGFFIIWRLQGLRQTRWSIIGRRPSSNVPKEIYFGDSFMKSVELRLENAYQNLVITGQKPPCVEGSAVSSDYDKIIEGLINDYQRVRRKLTRANEQIGLLMNESDQIGELKQEANHTQTRLQNELKIKTEMILYQNESIFELRKNLGNVSRIESSEKQEHCEKRELEKELDNLKMMRAVLIVAIAIISILFICLLVLWSRSCRNAQIQRVHQMRQYVKKNEPQKSVLNKRGLVAGPTKKEMKQTIVSRWQPENFSDLLDNSQMVQNVIVDDIVNHMETEGLENVTAAPENTLI